MIEAIGFLAEYIDILFLLIIVAAGRLGTKDEIVDGLPFRIKTLLLRVNKAWRVLIISAVVGIIIYFIRKDSGIKIEVEVLIFTFLLANTLYALFIKTIWDAAEKKIKSTNNP